MGAKNRKIKPVHLLRQTSTPQCTTLTIGFYSCLYKPHFWGMAKKKTGTKANPTTSSTMQQKKDYAKLLYTIEGVTMQKELAQRVGVSVQTINSWVNAEDKLWDRIRSSMIITKEVELRRMYMQITELNDNIMKRPVGQRFSDSKEADILIKLTSAVRQLETDTSISEVIEVMKNYIGFVRTIDLATAKEITALADQYIKSLIK